MRNILNENSLMIFGGMLGVLSFWFWSINSGIFEAHMLSVYYQCSYNETPCDYLHEGLIYIFFAGFTQTILGISLGALYDVSFDF